MIDATVRGRGYATIDINFKLGNPIAHCSSNIDTIQSAFESLWSPHNLHSAISFVICSFFPSVFTLDHDA
jgi:hypothetical protein